MGVVLRGFSGALLWARLLTPSARIPSCHMGSEYKARIRILSISSRNTIWDADSYTQA
jgi:hypothetical protein